MWKKKVDTLDTRLPTTWTFPNTHIFDTNTDENTNTNETGPAFFANKRKKRPRLTAGDSFHLCVQIQIHIKMQIKYKYK